MSGSGGAVAQARAMGLASAAFMVCASMIGTGVFTSLGFQAALPLSDFDLILLWIVGGALSLCGALAYGDLAIRMPRSGGETRFLGEIYGPFAGFLAGWISVTAGFAASLAACAFALASYGGRAAGLSSSVAIPAASLAIVALSFVHLGRLQGAVRFQNVFVALKLLLIAAFLVAAATQGVAEDASTWSAMFTPSTNALASVLSPGFATSFVYVSFAYAGWNAAVYVADEVRDVKTTLPRSLVLGTAIVCTLYVLLNAAFLGLVPRAEMAGRPDVAFLAAERLWGSWGGVAVSCAISIGLISTMSAMIWSGASVFVALGGERPRLRWLARQNSKGRPTVGIWLTSGLAIAMLFTSSFEVVIKLIGVLLATCASLAVAGVFILDHRAKRAGDRRTGWGTKAAASLFLIANSWVIVFLVREEPVSCAAALAILVLGAVAYAVSGSKADASI